MQTTVIDSAGTEWMGAVWVRRVDTIRPVGDLAYLKHDFELYGMSRPTSNDASLRTFGLPETVKVLYPKFVPMSEAWQWYWVDLFALSRYNRLYKDCSTVEKSYLRNAFKGATLGWRAFTNKFGSDYGYRDYVNNLNPDAQPMKQETITCGGNVVQLLSGKIRLGGYDVYKVRTLNGRKPPPNPSEVNHITYPTLVFKATVSRREGYNSTTKTWSREDVVIPFPQLGGSDVPIPFMADGDYNYIRAERIRPLAVDDPIPPVYKY